MPAHATTTAAASAPAATARVQPTAAQAAASFPTWGTRWVTHATSDINLPAVGMINQTSPGQDRITADYQIDTGRRVCEGSACSTFMAHITQPLTGYLTVVAVDVPEDRLPGVPVHGEPPATPPGSRQQTLQRAATWLTANNGRPVPYSQNSRWWDGYWQDCSGYASMALGLPTPGTNTVGLTDHRLTRPFPRSAQRRRSRGPVGRGAEGEPQGSRAARRCAFSSRFPDWASPAVSGRTPMTSAGLAAPYGSEGAW
ncbi:hypothetical protein NFX46_22700 [Streptomyces phaeoluteigriseus]|uniref:Uncharacterized protein n=1 Tax=Streptomyces phaeoluteigriseus TaxID=114686 RepID=A0ABY4ZB44_9ACTN|nr:hypothetical protein [Streptomyces phaeoluteigriseus]USQ86264.1 hypothetical protein NFX46_22700 [Streptomyces phaeoluteigriseus]